MSREVAPGSTDVFEYINVPAGATLTDLDYQYVRSGGTPSVKVDATAGTVGVHADNTAVYVDATDSPELAQVCFPDAAYAAGAEEVILSVYNPTEGWQRDLRVKLKHSLDGAIWWDGAASNANSKYGVDGSREKPVDDTAALLSLLASTGFNKIMVKGSLLLDVDISGAIVENWDGTGNVAFSSGNNVSNCIFNKMRVGTGIMIGNQDTKFFECEISNAIAGGVDGFQGKAIRCSLANTIGFADGGSSDFIDCYQTEGNAVTFDVNDSLQTIHIFDFKGAFTFSTTGGSVFVHIYSSGQTKINLASLLNAGDYILHGTGNLTDNSSGGTNVDLTDWQDIALDNTLQLSILSKLDYLRNGTAQAGAAGSITLDTGASAVDDYYDRLVVGINSGTGAGQAKRITAYNGTTKVATVDSNWEIIPDATSVFTLYPFAEVPVDINAIRDAILADSTPFNGGDIPVIVSNQAAINTNINDNETKIDSIIATLAGTLSANIVSINGKTNIDGVSLDVVQEMLIAMVNGRFKHDTPVVGQTTFYKRNNIDVLFVVQSSTTERTRISGP